MRLTLMIDIISPWNLFLPEFSFKARFLFFLNINILLVCLLYLHFPIRVLFQKYFIFFLFPSFPSFPLLLFVFVLNLFEILIILLNYAKYILKIFNPFPPISYLSISYTLKREYTISTWIFSILLFIQY